MPLGIKQVRTSPRESGVITVEQKDNSQVPYPCPLSDITVSESWKRGVVEKSKKGVDLFSLMIVHEEACRSLP